MERIIACIYGKFRQMGIVQEDDRDVFAYGLDLLLFTLLTDATLLALGALAGLFWHSFLLLAAFTVLQSLCGGYHASTHLRCFITTSAGWAAGMLLIAYMPDVAILPLPLYGVLAIWRIAPLEHENTPMSDAKKARMRKLGRTIAAVIIVLGTALSIAGVIYARPLFISLFLSGMSLTAGRVLNSK